MRKRHSFVFFDCPVPSTTVQDCSAGILGSFCSTFHHFGFTMPCHFLNSPKTYFLCVILNSKDEERAIPDRDHLVVSAISNKQQAHLLSLFTITLFQRSGLYQTLAIFCFHTWPSQVQTLGGYWDMSQATYQSDFERTQSMCNSPPVVVPRSIPVCSWVQQATIQSPNQLGPTCVHHGSSISAKQLFPKFFRDQLRPPPLFLRLAHLNQSPPPPDSP